MSRRSKAIGLLFSGALAVGPISLAYAVDPPSTQTPVVHPHRVHKKQVQLVLPPLPSGPLPQVPMTQLPPAAPRVTYENGLLAIEAENATLGEILRDVHKLTGASIDVPPNGASERVVTSIGPGAPRDVLAILLNGTAYNYVMLGTAGDPNSVATVVLTAKPAGAGEVQSASNVYEPTPQAVNQNVMPQQPFRGPVGPGTPFQGGARPGEQPLPGQAAAASDDNSDDADADDKDDDSDQSAPGQPVQPSPQAVAQPDPNSANAQPDQSSSDPNQPNAGPRTPEQMLELMRRGQPIVPPGAMPPQPQPQQ